MPGKCHFKDEWLEKGSAYEKWLRPVEGNEYRATCIVCNVTFDIWHSGSSSVKRHEEGKIHKQKMGALSSQPQISFTSKSSSSKEDSIHKGEVAENTTHDEEKSTNKPKDLKQFLTNEKVLTAEIIWALNKIMCGFSARGASKSSDLFKVMFPDSYIAEKFSMQKDKLGYIVSYGLGPYFQNALCNDLKQCDYYCVAIDESLNKISQKGQMDFIIRYWNQKKFEVSTRYLSSAFLGHSTAADLLERFVAIFNTMELPLNKILQVEMDGPNVNLKFSKELQSFLESDSKIIDSGTCSLHIIHGAYKTAHAGSEWKINNFLRSLYYLFKDFPSRRADFIYYTGSNVFPQKMCSIRWLENSGVIERALEMLPHLMKYIEATKATPPNSENYFVVQSFLNDKLLPAKLSFMQSIIGELEQFLTLFQSDKPLLPFLHAYYHAVMINLAKRFVKADVMAKVKNYQQLLSLQIDDIKNHLNIREIDIGFSAKSFCKNIDEKDVLSFRRECKTFLLYLYKKLLKKSPLNNKMVKGASCLSPTVMLTKTVKTLRLTYALEEFISKNIISGLEADSIKRTYGTLTDNEEFLKKCKSFKIDSDRLDNFLQNLIEEATYISEIDKSIFAKFVQNILIMFHGNAAIERGFSVNKECLVENLHEQSLISQRSIHSAVTAAGGVLNIEINKSILQAARNSSAKRREALEAKKKAEQDTLQDQEATLNKIKELKLKRKMLLQQAEEEADEIQKEITNTQKKLKKY